MSGRRRDPLAMILRAAMRLAAVPYAIAVGIRNRRYDRDPSRVHHADVPVISVGNITAGGTGKTPMVAWIARLLRNESIRVALVSRGYGADDSGVNDEALELQWRLPDVPHVQHPDRVAAAKIVTEELESQVIVLDDGFQHRRLHRDLNLVLIDATCPFGYGYVLPRGLLREPVSGLARADAVVLTRGDAVDRETVAGIQRIVAKHAPNALWAESVHAPSRLITASDSGTGKPDAADLESLVGTNVLLLCAIGNPAAFETTVERCGASVLAMKTFPDHHQYSRQDLALISQWAANYPDAQQIICTHKDLVKLQADRIGALPLAAITIEMKITHGEAPLAELIRGAATRPAPSASERP